MAAVTLARLAEATVTARSLRLRSAEPGSEWSDVRMDTPLRGAWRLAGNLSLSGDQGADGGGQDTLDQRWDRQEQGG